MQLLAALRHTVFLVLPATYLAWVAVAPFPKPSTFIGLRHADVRSRLGEPDADMPDKFIRWEKKRGFFVWEFSTDAPVPFDLDSPIQSAGRRLIMETPAGNITIVNNEVRDPAPRAATPP